MGLLDIRTHIPVRDLNIYWLIDGSSNMTGSRIGAVNDAMNNTLPVLEEIDNRNPDANIMIHSIILNDTPYSMYDEGKRPQDFIWQGIVGDGDLYFGRGLDCLTKCVKKDFNTKNFDSIFILLASSKSRDIWDFHLKRLRNIETFDWGYKIAIAIGDHCDFGMLQSFTGSEENIYTVKNIDNLKNSIHVTWSYPEWFVNEGPFHGCKRDMALIIDKSVELFGKNIIKSPRMFHILNDYEVFKSNRAQAFIFKTIQQDSLFDQLLESTNWYFDSVVYSKRLSQDTGIEYQNIQSVINAIGFGMGQTIYANFNE